MLTDEQLARLQQAVESQGRQIRLLTERADDAERLSGKLMANGLSDLLKGHGFQQYGGGIMRLGPNGIEILITDTSPVIAAWWVPAFSKTPTSQTPRAYIAATFTAGATDAYLGAVSPDGTKSAQIRPYATNGGSIIQDDAISVLHNLTADPDPAGPWGPGTLFYRTDLAKFRGYDGSWRNMATEVYSAGVVTTHEAAADPHTGYLKESTTVDFLVGTATGDLAGEIVVGATPGGELGGTWASPTVDATHSGSAHTSFCPLWAAVSPSQITVDQNNYSPAGLINDIMLRLTTDAARNITGLLLAAGTNIAGTLVAIHNIGAFTITLKDESASSTATNRFAFSGDMNLAADDCCILQYDATSTRWRALARTGLGMGTATPLVASGAGSAGTAAFAAHEDHVHPV